MAEGRPEVGLLDTSVVVDLGAMPPDVLPPRVAISSLTLAELAAGPHAAQDPAERARRQDLVQRVEAAFEPIPFDAAAARAYGRVYAAVLGTGRKVRGARAVDLLIAASALANDLPLYTRDGRDLEGVRDLLTVVDV